MMIMSGVLQEYYSALWGDLVNFIMMQPKSSPSAAPSPKVNDDHVWSQGNYEKIMKSINKGYNNRLEGAVYLSNGK